MLRDYNTRVEMAFQALDAGSTMVRISESGWKENQKDLDNSYMNCMGWTQMICSLKTYVEYGINLREGFF
ncbi:MAG: hypothetical protein FD174_731 [Geobacteraceae bacterium]|nr:MAG: hypothetical protein FD174_731 [Geobacteraceae bacterium]